MTHVFLSFSAGYANNEQNEEVLKLHTEMLASGIRPDHATLIVVLTACSALALLQRGKQTHAIATKTRLDCNVSLNNALITMYSKCGSIDDSDSLFQIIESCDVVSWNTIIAAWAQHGHYQKVLDLFHEMEASGFIPNGITFLSILSACRHSGSVKKSINLFNLMASKYGIPPRSEHYACLVDILCRAGKLEKAYKCIQEMPFKAEVAVWGAFLGGCQMYSNVEFAELAAEKLLQLDPHNSGAYIILSNIYAKAGMWEGVTRVRSLMKEQGVKKQPGYSWTEIADKLHFFLKGDTSHPDIDKVYSEVERISFHMEKTLGEGSVLSQ